MRGHMKFLLLGLCLPLTLAMVLPKHKGIHGFI